MSKGKYNKVLTVILVILLMAIIGIAGYLGYGYYQKFKSDKETSDVLSDFDKMIVELGENQNTNPEPTENNNNQNGYSGMGGINTNKVYYRGYKVIGKLEMPSINLQYPVLDMLTDAKAIDYSVAMQYGAGINKVGNTVIIGHNMRNGTFFGKNKRIKIGDIVYLTDLNGNRIAYEIYNKYITPGSDYTYANRNTNGGREVTLVTCDTNNKNRLIICAREMQ